MAVLVVNAGSSSIKIAVFDEGLGEIASGRVTEIGGAARVEVGDLRGGRVVPDHAAALAICLEALAERGSGLERLTLAAHRVVHGGAKLVQPCRITPQVVAGIEGVVPLAPLHNPANLTAIRALGKLAPDLPQYASFDTAFHATNPEVAVRYALPPEAEALGLRRYGFHGISYAGLVRALGPRLPERLLALHLGNGASLCAIRGGRSVATTMGYSPLEGLTMGTRTGGIDGNAVLRLAELHGVAQAGQILNRESGLLGLGGASDMRELARMGTARARFAREHFVYWAVRHAGSMIAAMGGLDGIAFTGGIGENDAAVRAGILDGLAWAGAGYDAAANAAGRAELTAAGSRVAIWTVAAEEERQIAREALAAKAAGA